MATAIRTVHAPKGPWNSDGGYEYNLVLIAIVFAIVDAGPGPWSIDGARGREHWGPAWALAALGAGLAGSAAAVAYGQQQDEPDAAATEQQPSDSSTAVAA
jgi:putative oxidoreductase